MFGLNNAWELLENTKGNYEKSAKYADIMFELNNVSCTPLTTAS